MTDRDREIFSRLTAAEQAIASHVAECRILREQQEKARREDRAMAHRESEKIMQAIGEVKQQLTDRHDRLRGQVGPLVVESHQREGVWRAIGKLALLVGLAGGVGGLVAALVGMR